MILHPSHLFIPLLLTAILLPLARGKHPQSPPPLLPIVRTNTFAVQGTTIGVNQTINALIGLPPSNITEVEIYYGVPYAQPPVGDLRLEKPLPVKSYTSLRNCTTWYNALGCHNFEEPPNYPMPTPSTDEDCLTSTILRPAGTSRHDRLPVLVYIYGGGFYDGMSGWYVPPLMYGFVDMYVPQGMIVVVINYRLTFLGWASDGTDQLSGNYGLYDQQMALRWVSENIGAFGGDPNRVTLMGLSAGSASIAYHTINPQSAPLFQQSIQMSGSYNNPWAKPDNQETITSTQAVANYKTLNCTDPTELKACLKNASIPALQAAYESYLMIRFTDLDFLAFQPVYDNAFISAGYADEGVLAQLPPKRSLIGYSTDESVGLQYFVALGLPNYAEPPAVNFTANDLAFLINSTVLPSDNSNPQAVGQIGNIRQALINFYTQVDDQADKNLSYFYYMQWARFVSDVQFIVPQQWEARMKSQLDWPTYIYHWNYCNNSMDQGLPYVTCGHASEMAFETSSRADMVFPSWNRSASDYQIQDYLVTAYVNFVKTGEPNPQWPLLNYQGHACDGASNYTEININTPTPLVENGGYETADRLAFWDELSSQYDLSLVHHFPNTQGQCLPPTSTDPSPAMPRGVHSIRKHSHHVH